MSTVIPSASDVVARLAPLKTSQLQKLAELSGVPFHTLLKIRDATTTRPRIDTVSQFWPHVDAAREAA